MKFIVAMVICGLGALIGLCSLTVGLPTHGGHCPINMTGTQLKCVANDLNDYQLCVETVADWTVCPCPSGSSCRNYDYGEGCRFACIGGTSASEPSDNDADMGPRDPDRDRTTAASGGGSR